MYIDIEHSFNPLANQQARKRREEGREEKRNQTHLGETGRPLPGLLTREAAQAVIFCFGGVGVGLVVEGYGFQPE